MKELKFTLAKNEELDSIFKVFNDAVKEMMKNNIDQWDDVYPNKEILKEDIDKKQLYLGRVSGEIASIYVINQECDEQYVNGKWQYPDVTYYVVHRLCVNPVFQHQGIARSTMIHLEEQIKMMDIESIRLDCFTLNPSALKLYDKLSYKKVGIANWRKGSFYLMEKILI